LKIEIDLEKKILIISLVISILIISLGVITLNVGVIANGIIISVFMIFLPLILFRYQKLKSLKEYEEKFPLFIRDVSESVTSGMAFHQAIIVSSRLDYGRLSKEVKKMANQISWGIPVDKVLDQFTERVKKSKRLYMGLKTLRESYLTGGDVISTLDSVAENLSILDDAQKERSSLLNQYVILMYAISFIFLGILVSINKLMIPIFQISSMDGSQALGISNPCEGNPNIICSIYTLPSYLFMIKDPSGIGAYYTSIFFFMSIIVAISCGLVAGQISENSITAGLKHSVLMTVGIVGAMLFLKYIGLLGV
jgi:flagellar protein FlaJ